jgi:Tol biopolymer transport system component
MNDTRELLERVGGRFAFPDEAFERLERRRDRKRRNQRIGGGVLTIILALVSFVALTRAFSTSERPADEPTPPAHLQQPGGIALLNGKLIDPTTGRSTGSLPIPDATDMSWSPDGSSLVYAAPGGVFVLVIDTNDTRQLVHCGSDQHACTVAWSPAGDEIAVAHDEVLEIVSVDGGREMPVGSLPRGDLIYPSWSPDGEQLAFTIIRPSVRALYTVARDGSDLTRIVEGTPEAIGPWAPSWSPDGSRIAFIDSNAWGGWKGPDRGWKLNVTVVDPDGTNPTVLTGAGRCFCLGYVPGLDWSPDGTRLALAVPELVGDNSGHPGVYTVDADGSGLTRLGRYVDGSPAWRPAG